MCIVVSSDWHLGQRESTDGRPNDRYVLVGVGRAEPSKGRFGCFWGKGWPISSSKRLCSKGLASSGKEILMQTWRNTYPYYGAIERSQ